MVNASCKVDFGRLEWVVGGKVYCEEENASGIWTVALFTHSVSTASRYFVLSYFVKCVSEQLRIG